MSINLGISRNLSQLNDRAEWLRNFGEPHAAIRQVKSDHVPAHKRLAEVAVHNHVGQHHGTVDGNARSRVEFQPLFLLFWI